MNWFGKKVSKVNRLESESVITPQLNGRRCSHLMASLLKQIFHLHLGFFYHKILHILPTKVRNEQREKHFSWVKTIKAAINVIPRAKHTKPTLTSGKRLLWYFWRAMPEVKKKTRLNFKQLSHLHSTPNSGYGVPTLWRSSWLSEEKPWNCRQILSRRRRGSEAENIWPGLVFKPDCYRDGVFSIQRGMWLENINYSTLTIDLRK